MAIGEVTSGYKGDDSEQVIAPRATEELTTTKSSDLVAVSRGAYPSRINSVLWCK